MTLNVEDPADSFFVVFRESPVWPAVVSTQRDGRDISVDSVKLAYGPEGQLIVEDEQVKSFRGTAYYKTAFAAAPQFLTKGPQVYLELGSVNVMAKVTVNDQAFDTLWMPPFQVDVTELLSRNNNELEIEVTSRCPDNAPGLLGPVQLTAGARMELKK